MPSQQERDSHSRSDRDEEMPDLEQPSRDSSAHAAAEVSSNTGALIEAIDDVLEEDALQEDGFPEDEAANQARDAVLDQFNQDLIDKLGLAPGEVADSAKVDALAEEEVKAFIQKGGQ